MASNAWGPAYTGCPWRAGFQWEKPPAFPRPFFPSGANGVEATVNLAKVMHKRLTITGSTMRPRPVVEKGEIARELYEKVWPLLESGRVKVLVDRVFPLAEAAEAHRYLEAGEHIGKVILKVA